MAKCSSVLLLPHYRDNHSFSLQICSKFTVTCCDLTLAGVNYLQQQNCIMKRYEILLAFSLLLVFPHPVHKKEGKDSAKKKMFFPVVPCSSPFLTKLSLQTRNVGEARVFLAEGAREQ